MGLGILCPDIMHIISGNQLQPCLLTHTEKSLVYRFLGINAMILQLQIKMIRPKNIRQTKSFFFCLLIKSLSEICRHDSCQACTQSNNPFMVLFQNLHIHAWLIIKALRKSNGNNLHQIGIACIILCQKHQMIITVISPDIFPVKPGTRCHIDLAADHRIDSLL